MPYKCAACEKSFRYKVSQRSHKCLPAATTTKDLPALTFNAEGEIIAQNFSDEIDIQKGSVTKYVAFVNSQFFDFRIGQ